MEPSLVAAQGFVAYIITIVLSLRIFRKIAPAIIVVCVAFIVYFAMLTVVVTIRPPFALWPTSAIYWFMVLCFLMCFGAIYKSISLRILANLLSQRDQRQDYQALLDQYVRQESYHDRLRILVKEGFAIHDEQKFTLTVRGLRIARIVLALQRAFQIDKSG